MTGIRTAVAFAAVSCALALVGATSAATPTNFHFTTTVPAGEWHGGLAAGFAGLSVMNIPHVGRATVGWSVTLFSYPPGPGDVHHSFSMVIEAANGDVLQLFSGDLPGAASSLEVTGPWHVASGSGRFESLSGSGTFSAITTGTYPDFVETITLTGVLQPSH